VQTCALPISGHETERERNGGSYKAARAADCYRRTAPAIERLVQRSLGDRVPARVQEPERRDDGQRRAVTGDEQEGRVEPERQRRRPAEVSRAVDAPQDDEQQG